MFTTLKINPIITPTTHQKTTVKPTGTLTLNPSTPLRLPTRKFTVQSIQSEPSISSSEFTSSVGSPSLPPPSPSQWTISQRHITVLNIAAFSVAVSATWLFCSAIPALLALKRAAESLEKLMDVAREELPGTMAAIRLSGMEISDLTMELSDMGWRRRWSCCLQDPGVEYLGMDDSNNRLQVLRGGALGMALVTFKSTLATNTIISTLAANPTFMSGLFACFMAQSIKVIINFFVEKKWDLKLFCASGGMPSSHSALCTALTTSVALSHGLADSLFPVSLGFTLIVMYDAIGVRRHAGIHAEVLNKIIEDLFQGHPISQTKLKELLGHTPSQVVAGALLGILVACFCCQGCLLPT